MIRRLGSLVVKRSVAIGRHKTSISLEAGFWDGLKEIAAHEGVTVDALVTRIDTDREHAILVLSRSVARAQLLSPII